MRARLKVDGLAEAVQRIDDTGERARRPEPALRSDATQYDLQLSERRKFQRGGWRRDTPGWIQEKRRRGLDTRTLRATGRLEAALVNAVPPVKMTVWNNTLVWGIRGGRTDLYYAKALAKGYQSSKGRVPARRMVVIDKEARGKISARVERYVLVGGKV